jgi:hypothetical protein
MGAEALLAGFALHSGARDGAAVAADLGRALEKESETAGIAEMLIFGPNIEMQFASGDRWTIECLGPEAFHVYPAVVSDGQVTWLNVWVAPDLTLAEMIERVREAANGRWKV